MQHSCSRAQTIADCKMKFHQSIQVSAAQARLLHEGELSNIISHATLHLLNFIYLYTYIDFQEELYAFTIFTKGEKSQATSDFFINFLLSLDIFLSTQGSQSCNQAACTVSMHLNDTQCIVKALSYGP